MTTAIKNNLISNWNIVWFVIFNRSTLVSENDTGAYSEFLTMKHIICDHVNEPSVMAVQGASVS